MKQKKILSMFVILLLTVFLVACNNNITKTYNVFFYDWNNTVLSTQDIKEGLNAVSPADPSREGYDFIGWDKEFTNVVTNLEVKAVYKIKTFTITWKNHDGTVLEIDENVEWGEIPEYNGITPTKEKIDEYEFDFIGWTPEINTVSGNYEYTADFEEIANSYQVVFKDYDEKVLKEEIVLYGSSANPPTDPSREGYDFTGWSAGFDNITGNLEIVATYKIKTFTIIWKDYGGTVLEIDENVKWGTMPIYNGLEPTREKTDEFNYNFIGWTPEVSAVSGNYEYTANFEENTNFYNVIFKDYDEKVLKEETVLYGSSANPPTDPLRDGYDFTGWSTDFDNVLGNLEIVATYQITTYTITYYDDEGSFTNPLTYTIETPTFVLTDAFKEEYTFLGWFDNNDEKIVAINVGSFGNIVLHARYLLNNYQVTIKILEEGTKKFKNDQKLKYGGILVDGQIYNDNILNLKLKRGLNTITLLTGHFESQISGIEQSKGIYLLNYTSSVLPDGYTLRGDVLDEYNSKTRFGEPVIYNGIGYATLTFDLQNHLVNENSIVLNYEQVKAVPTYYGNFSGGQGTIENPYQIRNINDLSKLSEIFSNNPSTEYTGGKYYEFYEFDNIIGNHHLVDHKGYIKPIGTQEYPFDGIVLAKGRAIKNLIIETSDVNAVGLFGYLAQNALIDGLVLENASIINNFVSTQTTLNGTDVYNSYAGGIAGVNGGVIANSAVTYITGVTQSSITSGNNSYVGGIAGKNLGLIKNSYNHYNVTGGYIAGGVTGINFGQIDGTYNLGMVTATYASGIAGRHGNGVFAEENIITNSYNAGVLVATNSTAGITHNFNKNVNVNVENVLTNTYFLNTASAVAFVNVYETGLTGNQAFGGLNNQELKNADNFSNWFVKVNDNNYINSTYYEMFNVINEEETYTYLRQRNFGYPLIITLGETVNVRIMATLNEDYVSEDHKINQDWNINRPYNQTFIVSKHTTNFVIYIERVNENTEFYATRVYGSGSGVGTLIPDVRNSSIIINRSHKDITVSDYTIIVNFSLNTVTTNFLNNDLVTGEENGQFNITYDIERTFTFNVNKTNLFVSTLQVHDGTQFIDVNSTAISETFQTKQINNAYGFIIVKVKTDVNNNVVVTVLTRGVNVQLRVLISANVAVTMENASTDSENNTLKIVRNNTTTVFEASENGNYNFSLPLGEFNSENQPVLYTYALEVLRSENANVLSKLYFNNNLVVNQPTGYYENYESGEINLVELHSFVAEFIRTEVHVNLTINKDYAGYLDTNINFSIKATNAINQDGEVFNVDYEALYDGEFTFIYNYNTQTTLSINSYIVDDKVFNATGDNHFRAIWMMGTGENLLVNALNENYDFSNNTNLEFAINQSLMKDLNVTLYLVRLKTISTFADLHADSLHTTKNPELMPKTDIDMSSITHKVIANGKTLPGAIELVKEETEHGAFIRYADIVTSVTFTVSKSHLSGINLERYEFVNWAREGEVPLQSAETDFTAIEVNAYVNSNTYIARAVYKLKSVQVLITNSANYVNSGYASLTVGDYNLNDYTQQTLIRDGYAYFAHFIDGKKYFEKSELSRRFYLDFDPVNTWQDALVYNVAYGEEVKIMGYNYVLPQFGRAQYVRVLDTYSYINGLFEESKTAHFDVKQRTYDELGYDLGISGNVYESTLLHFEYHSLVHLNFSANPTYVTSVSEASKDTLNYNNRFTSDRTEVVVTPPKGEDVTYNDLMATNILLDDESTVKVRYYTDLRNGYDLLGYKLVGWRVQVPAISESNKSQAYTITESSYVYNSYFVLNTYENYVELQFNINVQKYLDHNDLIKYLTYYVTPIFEEKTIVVTINTNTENSSTFLIKDLFNLEFDTNGPEISLGGEGLEDNQFIMGYYAGVSITVNKGQDDYFDSPWYTAGSGFEVTNRQGSGSSRRLRIDKVNFGKDGEEDYTITFNFIT